MVSWHQFALASGHLSVAELCRDFLKANFELVCTNVDFPNMECETLMDFLQVGMTMRSSWIGCS